MFEAPKSAYLVPFDGSFQVAQAARHQPTASLTRRKTSAAVANGRPEQVAARAHGRGTSHSVLLVFQAMDAAGKDSTIRSVMQGVDPAGCQVFSFKKPSNLGARPRLPLADNLPPAGTRPHRHFQSQPVRGSARRSCASQEPEVPAPAQGKIDLESIWDDRLESIDSPAGRASRAQRHGHPQVLAERLQGRTEAPLPVASRRGRQELEVRTQRRKGTAPLGRLHAGLRKRAERHIEAVGAVVCDTGGQQAIHAGASGGHDYRRIAEYRPAYPDKRPSSPQTVPNSCRSTKSARRRPNSDAVHTGILA